MNRVLALFLGIFLGLILIILVGFFVSDGLGDKVYKVYKYAGGCFIGRKKYAEGRQNVRIERRDMEELVGANPFMVPSLEEDLKMAWGINFKEKQTQPGVRLNGKWDRLGDEFECDRFPIPGLYLGDNRTRFTAGGQKTSIVENTKMMLYRRYYMNESIPGLLRGSWVLYFHEYALSGNFYAGETDKHFPCVTIDGFKRYRLGKATDMNVLYYPNEELCSVIKKRGIYKVDPIPVCNVIKSVIPKFMRIDFDEVNQEGWVFINDDQFAVATEDYKRIARAIQDKGSSWINSKAVGRKDGLDKTVHLQP